MPPEMTFVFRSFGSAILPLYLSGIQMMSPDLPRFLRPLPTTLHMRRANFEKSLQKLLVEHPTFSNIRVVDGTVRRIIRSEDGKSIISVGVRDLDGQSVTLDDVALVAGELSLGFNF